MTCYHPLEAAQPTGGQGIRPLVYARGRRPDPLSRGWEKLQLPCGQCIGCRLESSRTWAIRLMHEAQLYENNAFITLTYSDENIPIDGGLNKTHFQKFMKRLRKHFAPQKIRFFHCGEYGETFDRPHYHAILFNVEFADALFYKRERENDYFTSETLERLWGKGFAIIGQVTFESAAYVARYVIKKVNGPLALEHYTRDCPITGQVRRLPPEYATMSRRPGLASEWFEQYESDVYPWDEVVARGHPSKPPRYYDKKLEQSDPDMLWKIKLQREAAAARKAPDNTPARLHTKEIVKKAQLKLLIRSVEK
jgi:hypothetical protein